MEETSGRQMRDFVDGVIKAVREEAENGCLVKFSKDIERVEATIKERLAISTAEIGHLKDKVDVLCVGLAGLRSEVAAHNKELGILLEKTSGLKESFDKHVDLHWRTALLFIGSLIASLTAIAIAILK